MSGRKQFVVEEALDHAVEVFWRKGFSAAALSDLTAATGLGRGSLYGTFGDKSALFGQCLERYAESVGQPLLDALDRYPTDAVSAVQAMFATILARMRTGESPSGCLIAQSASELDALDDAGRRQVRALLRAQVRAVQRVIEADTSLDAAGLSARALAEHQVAVAQSLALLHRAGFPVAALTRIAETAVASLPRRT